MADNAYVQVFHGEGGKFYFHRRDGNHKIVSASEGYEEVGGALKGAANGNPDIDVFTLLSYPLGHDKAVTVARADAEHGRIGHSEDGGASVDAAE